MIICDQIAKIIFDYKCNRCDDIFQSNRNLKYHINTNSCLCDVKMKMIWKETIKLPFLSNSCLCNVKMKMIWKDTIKLPFLSNSWLCDVKMKMIWKETIKLPFLPIHVYVMWKWYEKKRKIDRVRKKYQIYDYFYLYI